MNTTAFTTLFILMVVIFFVAITAHANTQPLTIALQTTADNARKAYGLSALSLSVGLPQQATIIDITSGTIAKNSPQKITSQNLWQVGSVTKSFTATILLQLSAEKKINLNDTLEKWLPQYPRWKNITIQQLLNQTSGISDYIDSPNWWPILVSDQNKIWQPAQLVDLAYQQKNYFNAGNGWHYSNTNYVLLGMIIEKIFNKPLTEIFQQQLFNNPNYYLNNIYYLPTVYPQTIFARMVHGYDDESGDDMTSQNGSWLQAAGAMVATPHTLVQWYQLLFSGKILAPAQQKQLTAFVSTINGKPLRNITAQGYSASIFNVNSPYGIIWFTPGLTPGYRSLVAWLPCANITIAYSASSNIENKASFHSYMLSHIAKVLFSSAEVQQQVKQYQQSDRLPGFCKGVPTAEKI